MFSYQILCNCQTVILGKCHNWFQGLLQISKRLLVWFLTKWTWRNFWWEFPMDTCGFDQRTVFHLGKSSPSNNCAELAVEDQETNRGEWNLVCSQKDLSDEILWSGDQRVANILTRLVHFYEGWFLLKSEQGFPGGPVRSLVPDDPGQAADQLRPCAATTAQALESMSCNYWIPCALEPLLYSKRNHDNEKPVQCMKSSHR